MFDSIKKLFSSGPEVDYSELMKKGAQIVDVRSRGEYQTGHIKGSLNIPLNELEKGISKLKKDRPVITCCASGIRSASAKSILASRGFTEVYNGGGWSGLNRMLGN